MHMIESTRKYPIKIEVSWDKQDPSNEGWAYWIYNDAKTEILNSGGISGRQSRKIRPSRRRILESSNVYGRYIEIVFKENS
jgi:hypothetical protein